MKRLHRLLALGLVIAFSLMAMGAIVQPVPDKPKSAADDGTRAIFPGLVVDQDINKDTTWDKSYPFISVQANISVLPGVTLTIMPGVIVKFSYRTGLNINGTVIANGTYIEPIIFEPLADVPATLDWKGIRLQNDSVGCVFDYVRLEYADGGIAVWGSDPVIDHSELQYNHYYGVLCGEKSRPVIRNSYINFTEWAGIICGNNSLPVVDNNRIKTCYYGIVCYDTAEVTGNYMDTCWLGIVLWGDANVTFNDIESCRDGIHVFYSAPRIENNNIFSCDGNGTRFMGTNATYRNNKLQFNNVGIDISYDAKDILKNMQGNLVNGVDINTCFYVDQDDIIIDNLVVDSGRSAGFYGRLTAQGSVTLYDCQNVTFTNCNITNSQNAIYATNSTFTVYNSVFYEARKAQVYLDHNASGLAFNGSINPYNVTIGGPNCLFITYDELQVLVRDFYNEPVQGAVVVIRESQLVLHNVTTDSNGTTGKLLVKDGTVSDAGAIFSPLTVEVYTGKYNFQENPVTGVYVKDTKLVTFTDLGDIFPPSVAGISVEDGERAFPVNGTITITFNEPMNRSSVEEAFSISGNVTGTFHWSGWNLTFTPDSLEYQTDYLVIISTDAMDLWNNSLTDPVSFSFTTAAAPGAGGSVMLIAVIAIFAVAGIAGFLVLGRLKRIQ